MSSVDAQVAESVGAFAAVVRSPALRRVNLALAGSVIGDWAYATAVSIWVFQTGGPTALGLFSVARYVSMAVLGPVLATLADRYPKKLVMIGADLLRLVVVVIGAAVIATDGPTALIFGLGLAPSVISLAFRPAQASLLPRLADNPHQLMSANAVASTIDSVGFFIGPALAAGLLLATSNIEVVYLANALTFAISAALISGLVIPAMAEPEPPADEARAPIGLVRRSAAGFEEITTNPHLGLVAALTVAQALIAGASMVFQVSIVLDLLDLGESGVGLLSSILGVGGIVGGVITLVLARRQRIALDFGLGVMLWSAPLLMIVVWPTLLVTAVVFFLIGVGNSLVDVNATTIIQRIVPPEVMGRVFGALASLVTIGMAIGALLMPVLVNTIGLRPGLAALGGIIAVVAITQLAALRRIDTLALVGLDTTRRASTLGLAS